MNGGLSLRNVSMTLGITQKYSWTSENERMAWHKIECISDDPCLKFEDQWFYHKMHEIGARLPTQGEVLQFSVATIWYDTPLGFHQVERWNSLRKENVTAWCPENSIATVDIMVNHKGLGE